LPDAANASESEIFVKICADEDVNIIEY
jgi:hypothetical protein